MENPDDSGRPTFILKKVEFIDIFGKVHSDTNEGGNR